MEMKNDKMNDAWKWSWWMIMRMVHEMELKNDNENGAWNEDEEW